MPGPSSDFARVPRSGDTAVVINIFAPFTPSRRHPCGPGAIAERPSLHPARDRQAPDAFRRVSWAAETLVLLERPRCSSMGV